MQNKLSKSISAILYSSIVTASAHAAVLEELIVTAQKNTQSANDIGITLNAFSAATIKEMAIKSAEDIAAFTPSLTVNETAATGVPSYTIRGIGLQDFSTSASSTVGLYFDEVAMPYTVMSRGTIFDLERIEVLKGPQGDLYGRNTTAGQINFISAKPTTEFEAGIIASYGRFETTEVEGFISGPLSDKVQGRVAVKSIQSSEGWQKSLTRDDELGEKDSLAIRSIFNIQPRDDVNILVNLHYTKDDSDNTAPTAYNGQDIGADEFFLPYNPLDQYRLPGGANFGETPPWYSTRDNQAADWSNTFTNAATGEVFDVRPVRDNELKGFNVNLEWYFDNDITLSSITAYDEFEREEANDSDGGSFNDGGNINTTDIEVFSQELRLSGETDDLSWIAGLYYSNDEMDEFYNFFMGDSFFGEASASWSTGAAFQFFPILQLHTKYQQETESQAIFGHIEWSVTDQLRITAGARYTEEERTWSGCTFDAGDGGYVGLWNGAFGASLSPGACSTMDDTLGSPTNIVNVLGTGNINDAFHIFEETINTEKWMGKLSIDYAFTPDFLVYATLSNGFKSGGFNGANSNTTSQLAPYGEEELEAFETGLKATLLDGSMQINAAAFIYDYTDKQETSIAVTPVGEISGLTNVPESRISGFESDIQWQATEGLYLSLGMSYLDTEIRKWDRIVAGSGSFDFATGLTSFNTEDVSGQSLANAPQWSYNLRVNYEWSLNDNLLMDIGVDANFTDETSGGQNAFNASNDYTIVNARIGISDQDRKWRASVWSRNLTDEYYYPAAYSSNGSFVRVNGMPATYGVQLEYNF